MLEHEKRFYLHRLRTRHSIEKKLAELGSRQAYPGAEKDIERLQQRLATL
jgi:hypothetical protein